MATSLWTSSWRPNFRFSMTRNLNQEEEQQQQEQGSEVYSKANKGYDTALLNFTLDKLFDLRNLVEWWSQSSNSGHPVYSNNYVIQTRSDNDVKCLCEVDKSKEEGHSLFFAVLFKVFRWCHWLMPQNNPSVKSSRDPSVFTAINVLVCVSLYILAIVVSRKSLSITPSL